MERDLRRLFNAWLLLTALLILLIVQAWVPLGIGNTLLTLVIAAMQAFIVMFYFMHLGRRGPLLRLMAGAAFFWLAILLFLSLADPLTRDVVQPATPKTKVQETTLM